MKKFLVLYRATISPKEQMAQSTPDQAKASMAAWMAWMQRTQASLVDGGAPFGEAAALKGAPTPGIAGYSVVKAPSLEEAKQLFEGHPHFEAQGASIELLEMLAMPGM